MRDIIIDSKVFKPLLGITIAVLVFIFMPTHAMAGILGEYSFLHVTFNSVRHLFIFIFILVMIPFVLIIVLSWRFRNIKEDEISGEIGKIPPRKKKE